MPVPALRHVSSMSKQELEEYVHELLHCNDAEIEAWKAKNPSPMSVRRPSMSLSFNTADQIDMQLSEDVHRSWGWVVIRCCYDNEDEWREFLGCLRSSIRQNLAEYNGADISDLHELTVIEDPITLKDASVARTREVFNAWKGDALHREQHAEQDPETCKAQRYRYYLHVDKASVQDVIATTRAGTFYESGCVNLVSAEYEPGPLGGRMEAGEILEPVERIVGWHVGWIRFRYSTYTHMYYLCRDWDAWISMYCRPPLIYG